MQQRPGRLLLSFIFILFSSYFPSCLTITVLISLEVHLAVGILHPKFGERLGVSKDPGLWWGAQYWWLKVDQMVGCGTLCWQWLLSDNDYICCWGHWCSVKSQWSPDWLGDHSDWFIIVPCCSLNILNITPNCIIKWSLTLECWPHSIYYYEERLVKGVWYFLLHLEQYYYEYQKHLYIYVFFSSQRNTTSL